jgi:putative ABC transport system substrate-binding protein
MPRIGFLSPGPRDARAHFVEAFQQGLSDYGYIDGETISIEYRFAERTDQLPALAAELVNLPVDLIFTSSTPAAAAAKGATSTIPIVMAGVADPVGSGLVARLEQPGPNPITASPWWV